MTITRGDLLLATLTLVFAIQVYHTTHPISLIAEVLMIVCGAALTIRTIRGNAP